jgi:phosphatidate cytidylyltransferase
MKRILGALILIILLAVPSIIGPTWAFLIVALVVVPMCMYELFRVAINPSARILGWISLIASLPYLLFVYRGNIEAGFLTLCVASVAVIITSLFLFEKNKTSAKDIVYAIAGMIYPMALISFWVMLRNGNDGRFWLIFGLVSVFGSDAGAYYVGKNFGRRRIAPKLSPKKTVEGFIGGICTAIVLSYSVFLIYNKVVTSFQIDPLEGFYPVWLLVILSACIGVLDLAGDLAASLFKREFQVKDMGNLIPGHGGMLDRMDGVILTGCLLYVILKVAT